MKYLSFHLSEEEYLSFFTCTVLGSLYAMREQALSADIGIWGLGPPKVLYALESMGDIPHSLKSVLSIADELALLHAINAEKYQELLDTAIGKMLNLLSSLENPIWSLKLEIQTL